MDEEKWVVAGDVRVGFMCCARKPGPATNVAVDGGAALRLNGSRTCKPFTEPGGGLEQRLVCTFMVTRPAYSPIGLVVHLSCVMIFRKCSWKLGE